MALFATTEANAVCLEAVCKGTFANMLAASLRETPAYLKQFAVFYVKMVTFSVFITITHKFLCVRNAAGHRRAYSSEHNVISCRKGAVCKPNWDQAASVRVEYRYGLGGRSWTAFTASRPTVQ
jgi:hypothetical protein